ncbi:MAG: GNAT family N-acetyltransferase [Iphinoe sp. HA4291-MV1]|jgi:GNAT superfamily N-acetyltransferase|nr:GNAT family N-acetyltransferase [Iphinoe sp. HA4291-MV1]
MFKIVKRLLKEEEAKLVIKEIKLTPNIIGYSFREWMAAKNIMVAEDEDGKIAGVCLNYDFDQYWTKIAALFVLEKFRGKGLGKLMFLASFKDAIEREKNVYTISANPIVIKIMEELEFDTFKNILNFPKPYKKYKFVFYLHTIKWLMNCYRINEIIRKKLAYNFKEPFVYGLKICK